MADPLTPTPPGLVGVEHADPYGAALLAAQGVAGAGLLWPGRGGWPLSRPVRFLAQVALTTGAAMAATAMAHLGRDLRPQSRPGEDTLLHRDGAYAVARHPIYAGLLLGGLGLAVLRRRPEPLLAEAVLAAVLHAKSRHEDRLLQERFGGEWEAYAAEVPALVPRWGSRGSGPQLTRATSRTRPSARP